jgi:cytochrome c oxidase cbb3-type subunit 3/ubiquinol-cytochrome c reductase cytochrome c subunit
VPADQVLDFGILYGQNCAGCHGSDGKLGPAPPLNDPIFRAIVPEEELEGVITKGRNKTLMPAFASENGGTLTAAQIRVLVKEIKGISYKIAKTQEPDGTKVEIVVAPKWGAPGKPSKGVPSYGAPKASSEGGVAGNKEKGAVVFARACAVCHGKHGQGSDKAYAINDAVFLALISNQALRRFVITGRPDLDMPGYAEARPDSAHFVPLTDQEVTDLVALLASWREEK